MTFFIGAAVFIAAGYSLLLIFGLSRKHILYDICLSWFLGAGYYSLASFIFVYAAGGRVSALSSLLIVSIPLLPAALRTRKYLPHVTQSLKNVRNVEYLPGGKVFSLDTILVCYAIFIFTLIAVHGISTPSNGDDALRIRAYTPFIAYENNLNLKTTGMVLYNGIWPTYVTLLFWHIKGGTDHFYVNYTIITSLFFFLCLLYLSSAVRGNCRQGIYTVFLVLSIPLFVYQSTTTYADVRLAIPFALGLLFFTFYVRDGEDRDLKTMLIFFTIACFVKKNGEIAGLTGLFVAAAYTFYSFVRERRLPDIRASLYLLPLLAYFAVKQGYSNSVGSMFNLVASAANKAVDTVTLSSEISAADEYKLMGFFESLFLSGNFGILFYVLIASVVFNYRKVFTKNLVWEFAFITIVFLEIFYYMVFYFSELEMHSAIVHRTVIILSVVSSVFLASLWAGPDEEKSRGG